MTNQITSSGSDPPAFSRFTKYKGASTISFRGMYAVDHLNMTVPMGAIYGFIGENGSGKSTTIKLLCGSLGAGMLLFMMVSMITPLGSTFMHVILCLAGGVLFAVGLGAGSN